MRACSTGVFGSCLLLCAPTIGAVRGGGVKNCAPPLESEHESRLLKKRSRLGWLRDSTFVRAIAEVGDAGWRMSGLASCSATSILRSGFGRIIRCERSEGS